MKRKAAVLLMTLGIFGVFLDTLDRWCPWLYAWWDAPMCRTDWGGAGAEG